MGSHASDAFKVKRLRRGGSYREWAASVRALLVEADLDVYLDVEADEGDEAAVRKHVMNYRLLQPHFWVLSEDLLYLCVEFSIVGSRRVRVDWDAGAVVEVHGSERVGHRFESFCSLCTFY